MIVTGEHVESRLIALSKEYDAAHEYLETAERRAYESRGKWEIAAAKVRLGLRARALDAGRKMTVQEVEDEAIARCSAELMEFYLSEAEQRIARANSARLRTQVDITRSIGTSVRAAMDMA